MAEQKELQIMIFLLMKVMQVQKIGFRLEFQKMLKNINFGLYDAVIAVDQFRIGRTDDFSKS